MPRRSARGVVLVVALLGACARFRQPVPSDTVAADGNGVIEVEIQNHNWSDLTISLNHGGRRTRIGTAAGARASVFKVPASYFFARRVTLRVAPIGSRETFDSESFSVEPGQVVVWTIESNITRSSLQIR